MGYLNRAGVAHPHRKCRIFCSSCLAAFWGDMWLFLQFSPISSVWGKQEPQKQGKGHGNYGILGLDLRACSVSPKTREGTRESWNGGAGRGHRACSVSPEGRKGTREPWNVYAGRDFGAGSVSQKQGKGHRNHGMMGFGPQSPLGVPKSKERDTGLMQCLCQRELGAGSAVSPKAGEGTRVSWNVGAGRGSGLARRCPRAGAERARRERGGGSGDDSDSAGPAPSPPARPPLIAAGSVAITAP